MKLNQISLYILTCLVISAIGQGCSEHESTTPSTQIESNNTSEAPTIKEKTFIGTIDRQYKIEMRLSREGDVLTGNYNYKGNSNTLRLEGEIDSYGSLRLHEFNDSDKLTGIFEGYWIDEEINGTWNKPDGSQSLGFVVIEPSNSSDLTIVSNEKNNDIQNNNTISYTDAISIILDDSYTKAEKILGEPNASGWLYGAHKKARVYFNKVVQNGEVKHLVLMVRYNDGSKKPYVEELYAVSDGQKAKYGIHWVMVDGDKVISNSTDFN